MLRAITKKILKNSSKMKRQLFNSLRWPIYSFNLVDIVAHRNWLAQKTTTNRIISSQGLIIIRSRRNTFIIRNENKHKSSLYLVAKFRKCQCKLTSVAGRYNICTLQVSTESFTDFPGKRVYKRIFQVSGFNRQTKKILLSHFDSTENWFEIQ